MDKQSLKIKLFEMLSECDNRLAIYKELCGDGLSKDEKFEAIFACRKKIILEIIELINDKK